jgi:hypothetical protein
MTYRFVQFVEKVVHGYKKQTSYANDYHRTHSQSHVGSGDRYCPLAVRRAPLV